MESRNWKTLSWSLLAIATGVLLLTPAGCQPANPNAHDIEKPIVTDDAPQTSEEAAAQSEPPPIEYKRKPR
ncbi:hypothetical protein [Paludisphaera soli]|uniref:hypothetical protein n=1 Tax=Paludisphaera soli TaxID=2712865 RepID=UPI0013E9F54E|nr:hypothetical protein [Paludisphaera soli]